MPGAQIGAAISCPRIAGGKITDMRTFLRKKKKEKDTAWFEVTNSWRFASLEVLRPRVGRADITELILSFLDLETHCPLKRTANGGWMHCDTGSANLDLFFQAVPESKPVRNLPLQHYLQKVYLGL